MSDNHFNRPDRVLRTFTGLFLGLSTDGIVLAIGRLFTDSFKSIRESDVRDKRSSQVTLESSSSRERA